MSDLPYTYTEPNGDSLRMFSDGPDLVVTVRQDGGARTVVVPREETPNLARAVLAAAGDTGHVVISQARLAELNDRIAYSDTHVANAARSMRERAAEAALDDPTADYDIRRQIRALPLLPDGDTLPEEDLVEPGDEAPDLVERLALDLAGTTKAVTKRLAVVEGRLGITDEEPPADGILPSVRELRRMATEERAEAAPERPARYRDADGDLWEETSPGYLLLDVRRLPHVRMARPYAVVDGEFGPLTPVTTDSPPAPCEVCGRAPDEQEHGPDGRCRHTPATRLGRPTT